jgi:3-oxoacyl-[acyl-carrier-protein] synthase-3
VQSRRAKFTAIGTYVPERIVTNEELSRTLETSDEWITSRSGISERRIASPGQAASDLGAVAASRALQAAGVDAASVDTVIVASLSPDMIFPSTASLISGAIGTGKAAAFDLSAACTGFIYALAVANSFIQSGQANTVLVTGAEVVSKMIDWTDRSTAVLFGDGAGAVLLQATTGPGSDAEEGIIGFELGNDPQGAGLLSLPGGGSRLPASAETVSAGQHYLQMNGREVFKFATRVIVSSAQKILADHGFDIKDVNLFVPHQANIRIIETAARKLGISPDRVFSNLSRYGNTSCASIPLSLDEAAREGRIRPGDLVLMTGFGAGLSWGSCLARFGDFRTYDKETSVV